MIESRREKKMKRVGKGLKIEMWWQRWWWRETIEMCWRWWWWRRKTTEMWRWWRGNNINVLAVVVVVVVEVNNRIL